MLAEYIDPVIKKLNEVCDICIAVHYLLYETHSAGCHSNVL